MFSFKKCRIYRQAIYVHQHSHHAAKWIKETRKSILIDFPYWHNSTWSVDRALHSVVLRWRSRGGVREGNSGSRCLRSAGPSALTSDCRNLRNAGSWEKSFSFNGFPGATEVTKRRTKEVPSHIYIPPPVCLLARDELGPRWGNLFE